MPSSLNYNFFLYTHIYNYIYICDRLWENRPLRAQYDFSVEAFVDYLTRKK